MIELLVENDVDIKTKHYKETLLDQDEESRKQFERDKKNENWKAMSTAMKKQMNMMEKRWFIMSERLIDVTESWLFMIKP